MTSLLDNFLVPNGPVIFSGRKKELEILKTNFSRYNLFIIDGISGIGKTALALTFSGLISEDEDFEKYHEKILWYQFEEGSTLESFLYEFRLFPGEGGERLNNFFKNIELDLRGKLRAFINMLNSENYIIFIDDYQRLSKDEGLLMLNMFNKFLKKTKIFVITSEKPEFSPMEWFDIFELNLSFLNKQETLGMIKNLINTYSIKPINDNLFKDIYSKISGHPFLIKSFVSVLLTGDRTADELIKEFSDFSLMSEEYIMNHLLRELSSEERNFLISLSVYRKPVFKDGIDFITSCNDKDNLLIELKKKFLIDILPDKKYFIPTMIRNYCFNKSDKKEYHFLAAKYYIHLLNNKDIEIIEGGKEAFYHFIQAEKYKEASQILEVIMEPMLTSFQPVELEKFIDIILKFQKKQPSSFYLVKAELMRLNGKLYEAVEFIEDIVPSLKEKDRISFYILQARILSRIGEWEKSLDLIFKIIPSYNIAKDKSGLIKAYSFIGSIFRLKGDYEKALDYYYKGQALNKEPVNEKLDVNIKQSIAIIYGKNGKTDEAYSLLKECLAIAEDKNLVALTISIKNNMASLLYEKGDFDEALKLWNNSLGLSEETEWKEAIVHSLIGLSLIYNETGEPQRAFSQYTEALNLSCHMGDNYLQSYILVKLGEITLYTNIIKGEEYIVKAMELAQKYNFNELLQDIYLCLCKINFLKNNRVKLMELLDKIIINGSDYHMAIAYRFKYLLEADISFLTLSEDKLSCLSGVRKRKAEQYMSSVEEIALKISPLSSQKDYFVKMRERVYNASLSEVNRLREKKKEFDIFIDSVNGKVWEKDKGDIDILTKKSISELLFFFAKRAGEFFSPKELFPFVWQGKYIHSSDSPAVKMGISRLRKLIEPGHEEPRYLKLSPVRYKEERKYYFDDSFNYCYIEKIQS